MFRSRCHRPEHKIDSIEYSISSYQISFLLVPTLLKPANSASTRYSRHTHPSLVTFPSDATLRMILAQEDLINLAAEYSSTPVIATGGNQQHNTAHFELEGNILDENTRFSSILLKNALVLVINDNIRLKFHESKRLVPNAAILREHRKGLFNRLPIDNGQRPPSDKQLTYPNESLDLLFDTLHGELSYLTEYLKSHIGEKHKFTIYPIQKQKESNQEQWNEWETGIYKMRGDTDGTVNIALTADWYVYIFLII